MLGKDEHENKKKPKHTSADDLNDGFILDKDDRRLLSYKVRCAPPPSKSHFLVVTEGPTMAGVLKP